MKWIGYFLILAPCQWFEIYISLAQLQSALEEANCLDPIPSGFKLGHMMKMPLVIPVR